MAQPPLTRNQTCARPPSTNTSLAVMKLLSSEARNKATAAVSSGLPTCSSGADWQDRQEELLAFPSSPAH